MEYIGVDGCRDGWFWVGLSDSSGWRFGVCKDAKALGAVAVGSKLTLIDVPIGLKEAGPEERLCDKEARRMLRGPRSSSVFRAPARPAVLAKSYPEANVINRRATGFGLSRQAWGIAQKIREVDELLRVNHALRKIIREAHPEVCFCSLNDRQPMSHNKKQTAGRCEREELLARILPESSSIIESAVEAYRRNRVAWDDILDALAAAATAKLGGASRLRTLPANPSSDACGLPMEMVFVEIRERN